MVSVAKCHASDTHTLLSDRPRATMICAANSRELSYKCPAQSFVITIPDIHWILLILEHLMNLDLIYFLVFKSQGRVWILF